MSKRIVAASLLAADFLNFETEVKSVEKAGIDWLHIDVMDGHFVPQMAITAPTIKALRAKTALTLDVHLMIQNPAQHIESYAQAGADYLSIHYEAEPHLHGTLAKIRALGMKAGVAINPATPISALQHVWPLMDQLLIMTVNPGAGGQKFLHDQIVKIHQARKVIDSTQDVSTLISIDGGINAKTAVPCWEAGADILGAGSGIFSGNSADYSNNIKNIRGTDS